MGGTLLIRAIAYCVQEKALGGLKPSAQRVLDRVCDEPRGSASVRITKTRINAGTVLIRQWRGVRHRSALASQILASINAIRARSKILLRRVSFARADTLNDKYFTA